MDQAKTPVDDGPKIDAATLTCTVTALVSLLLRLFVRTRLIKNIGWDDFLMAFAMVLCVIGQGIIVQQVNYGAGRHWYDISEDDWAMAIKLNFITQPFYVWARCFVKLSIGAFLLRVAVLPLHRRTIIGIMSFIGLYTLGCFFTIIFQCTNLAVQWDKTATGTCWTPQTLKAVTYTNAALNIFTDIIFALVIPIIMLWSVQMNRLQKWSIISILGLGVLATAAALVKVSYLPGTGKSNDLLWDARNITIWTVVECNIGIVAGNLPCLKPLIRGIFGSLSGSSRTTGSGNKNVGSKYLGRSYGTRGTRGTVRDYGDAHMMTAMEAEESKDTISAASSAKDASFKEDSPFAGWGAITINTEVDVRTGDGDDRSLTQERKQFDVV